MNQLICTKAGTSANMPRTILFFETAHFFVVLFTRERDEMDIIFAVIDLIIVVPRGEKLMSGFFNVGLGLGMRGLLGRFWKFTWFYFVVEIEKF